jgi:hypothetical protein
VRQRADDVLALDVRHAADLVEALERVQLRLRSGGPGFSDTVESKK